MDRLPSREEYLARWGALHGGYDPEGSVLVGGWLRAVHGLARPLARAGIRPDVVTAAGLLASAAAVWPATGGGSWLWLSAGLVLLAGLLDGLDGAVAVLAGRTSRWGYVLDSVVDRGSDALFLVTLWVAGAPAGVCVGAGVAAGLLEYARARAGSAGMDEIGVVTVAERPTRVLVTAGFLGAAAAFPSSAATWLAAGAWVWLVLSVLGTVQLLVVVRRRLAAP